MQRNTAVISIIIRSYLFRNTKWLNRIRTNSFLRKKKDASHLTSVGFLVSCGAECNRSITIPQRSLSVEGSTSSLQEHRSVSQLSSLTSWSCQANARRNKKLSLLCPLKPFQSHSTASWLLISIVLRYTTKLPIHFCVKSEQRNVKRFDVD